MDFAELYQAREEISDKARVKVGKEVADLYGMKLIDVIVDEPHAPTEIQSSYNNVKASERNKLAAVNDAEANKIRVIAEAEARREALRLDGEGIAAQRKAIFENYAEQFNQLAQKGLTQSQAHQVISLAMANDTVRDAAKNGNVIITTTNSNDILGQLSALGKTLTGPAEGKPANDAAKPAKFGRE
jgi:regulator of protease activity HflC (stomatin/prohibitin superfamily)